MRVIKEIETIDRSFFWSGPDLKKSGAKISWEHLCSPHEEGGCGFKSLKIWNKAAVAKHIWFLISGGEKSMWCRCVKSYLMKGRNFWNLKMPSDPFWVWRKLLNLGPLVQPHIKSLDGNGIAMSLWFDNCHPLGPLVQKFEPRIIYDLGLSQDTKVAAIMSRTLWAFPATRTFELN